MSFLSDTAKWTKWYSKHAWNPWWLIKDHALSDQAFRDYQAETGGDIKWAKRARNTGRAVAALLGAYYGAAALGAGGAGGGGGGVAGGTAGGGGEAALGGLGGVEPISYSGFTSAQGGIGSLGSGWGNAGVVAGEGGSGAAGTGASASGLPEWAQWAKRGMNAIQNMPQGGQQQQQYGQQSASIEQYPMPDDQGIDERALALRKAAMLRSRIAQLRAQLGEA
jgi:hypothetical protein